MHNTSSFQPSISSQISHELRIPLTGILGMVHCLNKTSLTIQQREFLNRLSESAQQLLGAESKIHAILKTQSKN